ncbi:MAG: hypothetical protein WB992_01905, partial [Bryobacteraceae bacterium]
MDIASAFQQVNFIHFRRIVCGVSAGKCCKAAAYALRALATMRFIYRLLIRMHTTRRMLDQFTTPFVANGIHDLGPRLPNKRIFNGKGLLG